MNKKMKKLLIASLSVASVFCCAIAARSNIKPEVTASATTVSSVVTLRDGASCRIRTANDEDTGSGLRFTADLDATQWKSLTESYEMSAGIIIVPTDYIDAAGGHTHSALDAASKKFLDFCYSETDLGEYTNYGASIVDILAQNYTRKFSGIAYVKSTTAIDGYEEYDGAYYSYSDYYWVNNSRSVYEVASKAYNDRKSAKVTDTYENAATFNEKTSYSPYDDLQREVLKGYMDGVIDLGKNAYAKVVVKNNTEYYTSPYTVVQSDFVNEWYIRNANEAEIKTMLYKGTRIKDYYVQDGVTTISFETMAYHSEVKKNEDGTVTMPARQTGGAITVATVAATDTPYIAFKGEYGIGTYVDFTFTGNNMPQVMFFADNINGDMTSSGGSGVLCMNGLTKHEGTESFSRCTDYLVFGPNRLNGTYYEDGQQAATILSTGTTANPGNYPLLSQTGLRTTPDTNYKYTVGTFAKDGYLYMDIYLYNADTDRQIYHIEKKTSISSTAVTAGNIVAYTCWKGSKDTATTTFGYSEPYKYNATNVAVTASSGVTFTATTKDSTVKKAATVKGCQTGGPATNAQISSATSGNMHYIAFAGNYGVGTYVDFKFTGNNMPQVMFFADQINSDWTSTGGSGIICVNGIMLNYSDYTTNGFSTSNTARFSDFLVFGPNRISSNYDAGNQIATITNGGDSAALYETTPGEYPLLTQAGLTGTPNTEYAYRIGTYEGDDGYLYMDIWLWYAENDKLIYHIEQKTSLLASGVTAGNIIAYAGLTASSTTATTTFEYFAPVGVQVESGTEETPETPDTEETVPVTTVGATQNDDGTITLAAGTGNTSGNFPSTGYGTGASAYVNNYLAFDDEYGVGTYVDFYFTGNNMPQVMLFANDQNFTCMGAGYDGSKMLDNVGYLIANGIYSNNTLYNDFLYVHGPKRISTHLQNQVTATNLTYTSGYEYAGLTDGVNYKYVVGSYVSSGVVVIELFLYNADTNELIVDAYYSTGKAVSAVEAYGKKIVVYAGVKGADVSTTFSYSAPYIGEYNGEEIPVYSANVDKVNGTNSVTLSGMQIGQAPNMANISSAASSHMGYIAFSGNYGIGTYVDFVFKGNNMPQVMFFADNINVDPTSNGGKGVICMNGLMVNESDYTANGATTNNSARLSDFLIYGPNRISGSYDGTQIATVLSVGTETNPGDYPLLSQAGLRTTPDTEYLYTVGTFVWDGYLGIDVYLYNNATGELIYHLPKLTSLPATEVSAGSIVAYAGFTGSSNTATTSFEYFRPYTRTFDEGEYLNVLANADGSITLYGQTSYSAGWESGVSQLNNSYIAFEGEYQLGTEARFVFKGNNLPQVMLFADKINGNMSSVGGQGILITNGLYVDNLPSGATDNYLGANTLLCFGPDRINENYYSVWKWAETYANNQFNIIEGAWPATFVENVSYEYVVWTEEAEGTIVVYVELFNAVTMELIASGAFATGISVDAVAAGNIIAYAGVKGNAQHTTFFYEEPCERFGMNFYAYSAPGTYTEDGVTADWSDQSVWDTYAASGLNVLYLTGANMYGGEGWASSNAKAKIDLAKTSGIERFILRDSRLYANLDSVEGGLIGSDKKFATQAELDQYVRSCLIDYIYEDGIYGLALRDEPNYCYAESYGQVYQSIKRVSKALGKELYVQINLLPLDTTIDAATQLERYGNSEASIYDAYAAYLDVFFLSTQADTICVDNYPFRPAEGWGGDSVRFLDGYYTCFQILAEKCKQYNAKLAFVLQSFELKYTGGLSSLVGTETGCRALDNVNQMYLQMNSALGFGVKEISFYTYVTVQNTESNYTVTDGSSFVKKDGTTTDIYDWAKETIAYAKEIETLVSTYDYSASSITVSSAASSYSSIYAEGFTNDAFALLSGATIDKHVLLVTEMYKQETGSYMYMASNVLDTAYGSGDATVTMTFTGYTQVYVVENGVGSYVSLTDGVYTTSLSIGEAVYVIPVA